MVAHDHNEVVPGCFRCDLSGAETANSSDKTPLRSSVVDTSLDEVVELLECTQYEYPYAVLSGVYYCETHDCEIVDGSCERYKGREIVDIAIDNTIEIITDLIRATSIRDGRTEIAGDYIRTIKEVFGVQH